MCTNVLGGRKLFIRFAFKLLLLDMQSGTLILATYLPVIIFVHLSFLSVLDSIIFHFFPQMPFAIIGKVSNNQLSCCRGSSKPQTEMNVPCGSSKGLDPLHLEIFVT